MPLEDYDSVHITYLHLRSIAWNVIGWGGILSFLTGLLNGLLTKWGLFRYTWIKVKLASTIGMILLGMFYTEQKMLVNLQMLENDQNAMRSAGFLANHVALQWVVPIQLLLFFLIVLISLLKPWMKEKRIATN